MDTDWSAAMVRQQFRRRLLNWFRAHARDLPWRRTRDIYAIWISEVMLQQTQVATVIPYFERFIKRFPTVETLATADEQEVLRYWEGLGYYRRARQLHAAAKEIVGRFGGHFPASIDLAQSLPGIGRYTAGAILSIARDERLPILEANTIRLLCRLMPLAIDPKSTAAKERLWEFSASLLPRRNVGAFNQALMELGSTVCSPRAPRCDQCPVAGQCVTRAHGWQERIPVAPTKKVYSQVIEAALVLPSRADNRVLLRRCGPDERWAGLWDFPRFPVTNEHDEQIRAELKQFMQTATRLQVELGPLFARMKHGVTRYRITLLCYRGELVSRKKLPRLPENWCWIGREELERFPLSTTGRKISRLVFGAS